MTYWTAKWERVKASRLGLEREEKPRCRWRWPWVRRSTMNALVAVLKRRAERAEAEAKEARVILAAFSKSYYTPASRRPRG